MINNMTLSPHIYILTCTSLDIVSNSIGIGIEIVGIGICMLRYKGMSLCCTFSKPLASGTLN